MTIGFTNLVLLFALAALAIPPIIHLLNRRRYVIVDWGAMQFLEFSQRTQRRVLWKDLLLMLLRMGLIALLVLGLAGPFVGSQFLATLGRTERDIVLVLDASASMSYDDGSGGTPFKGVTNWTRSFIKGLGPGNRVALLQAQQQVLPIVPELTTDVAFVEQRLAELKPPAGACRWPGAVLTALKVLSQSKSASKQIILVGDDQRYGFADAESVNGWEQVASALKDMEVTLSFVTGKLPSRSNYSVSSLGAGRAAPWVGQAVPFKAALKLDGFDRYVAPRGVYFEVNGKRAGEIKVPQQATLEKGQIPFSFSHRFASPGVHLVSVIIDSDPQHDHVPADNRRDLAVEVVASLPIVIVDGSDPGKPESSSFFLQKALNFSPTGTKSGVKAQVVATDDFERTPSLIEKSKARAIVLADVPAFTPALQKALAEFVSDGGGLMIVLGNRAEQHREFYRQFDWLPAKLERIQSQTDSALDRRSLIHPSLEAFRDATDSFAQVKFPRWWKVIPSERALVGASFSDGSPWLVEKEIGKGRVLLVTAPLDRSWECDLPTRWEFPVLAHELIYHLAKARSGQFNVEPGQPIRVAPEKEKLPAEAIVQPPGGKPQKVSVQSWPLVIETSQAGVYRVEIPDQPPLYFVASPDARESDLTPSDEADRERVARIVPIRYVDFSTPVANVGGETQTAEVWWLFFLAVVLLLCVEVWMTRRMAVTRGAL